MSPVLINGCQPGEHRNLRGWQPRHPWPAEARMQFTESPRHGTAFIEVFLERPDPSFLRMDGATLEETEELAWAHLTRWRGCDHQFVRRDGGQIGSNDTCGRCTRCGGVQTDMFLPLTKRDAQAPPFRDGVKRLPPAGRRSRSPRFCGKLNEQWPRAALTAGTVAKRMEAASHAGRYHRPGVQVPPVPHQTPGGRDV